MTRALPGWRGFDCNSPLSAEMAVALRQHGYDFAIRYVPRVSHHANDLTLDEVLAIRASGLSLGVVQHVESDTSWVPEAAKGTQYGTMAAWQCATLGISKGVTVWLDLEGVAPKTPAGNVIAYCNNWFRAVASSGFEPGLYVGWHPGLSPGDLYRRLSVQRYWGSYNLDLDEYPAVRGLCMKQQEPRARDLPPGVMLAIDTNTVMIDKLGGLPTFDSVSNSGAI